MEKIEEVEAAVKNLRVPRIIDEYQLQNMVAEALRTNGLEFKKEYRLGVRNRIDFLVDGGIGVEIKKGKPPKMSTLAQVNRYADHNLVTGIILIVEQLIHDVPEEINGKPCKLVALNKLWGIAI